MPTRSGGCYDDKLSLEDAVKYLRELLVEFPFTDWRDDNEGVMQSRSQAVHITAMLSQFAGRLIPRESSRLGFFYNSNSQRSGKSLLMKMAIIPTNGWMAGQAWNTKEEEMRKVLDAEVLRASRYIAYDNVRERTHISSQTLEGFMTLVMWTGRLLGKTQMFTAQNLATVFIAGNNLTVSSDLKQRMLECKLFVSEANVQLRQVKHPIDDAWLMDPKNSLDIRNALWAIIRHWADNGQYKATENLRLGYEPWCRVFGGLVKFAGFGDPLAPPEDEDEEDIDTEAADMRALVKILAEPILHGETKRVEYPFQEVVNVAHHNDLFDWMLDGKEVSEHAPSTGILVRSDYVLKADSRSKFGKLLKRYAPYSGELQGPRHRSFWFGKGDQSRQIKTSSCGRAGRRKFVAELAEKQQTE